MTLAGVFKIVIGKLRHWEEPYPIILLLINKSIKIYFYYAVLSFCLYICLKVEYAGESSFDDKEVT